MKQIVIFASGSGTNMQRIAEYFRGKGIVNIQKLYCNRQDAYVLERAKQLGIPAVVFGKDEFYHTDSVVDALKALSPDLIVLAGFLWKVPEKIIQAFPRKIINIHPALLPKYGGKGMYGEHVHRAVIESGDVESGITVHYVNENYDEGDIIIQAKCAIQPDDTPATLAQKIHNLEYGYFPVAVEQLIIDN
ncbi:MAG: phosphoribosylglycinamide formyltransferase [Bacteroidales bacterium]|jgi:phosphoribosylglycinamide formyltransferase-1|nr:phosphoribosylglycinamide formyltransferase [Bacteroidales bacterium]